MDDTSALSHVLPDVIEPGLGIVFCGTAAGTVSARPAPIMLIRRTGSGRRCMPSGSRRD